MNILITGATGFVGKALVVELLKKNHSIIQISRSKKNNTQGIQTLTWDEAWPSDLVIDAVIHLAGENVAIPWTDQNKEKILSSRIQTSEILRKKILELKTPVKVVIAASAIGIYGTEASHQDQELDENSPQANDFLADVCIRWEQASLMIPCERLVQLRIGVILDPSGGALAKMLPAFKLGLGGKLGSGEQWFSWISRTDLLSIIQEALVNIHYQGVYNAVAPTPLRNKDFTQALVKALHRPGLFTVPKFVIKTIFGEMGMATLFSNQRVSAKRLLDLKFPFKHRKISDFLSEFF
jgi:uncharacterized protein (TIGR01777 family)